MAKVSISRCDSYREELLDAALEEALSGLGGISSFIKPGQKVLLKPNLLMSAGPELAVTTHPLFVKCVAKQVLRAKAVPFIGDSPGGLPLDMEKVYQKAGYLETAKELGIETVNFLSSGTVEVPSPHNKLIPALSISKKALEFDAIINLPKLKTHALTRFTGAVKNMFGCVPGFHKSQFHFIAPDPEDFAGLIADVFAATRPVLNIMDAVTCMEGMGPSAGEIKKVGLVLASCDGVALDSIASKIIGFDPFDVPVTRIAFKNGTGEARLSHIDIFGADISAVSVKFKKPFDLASLLKYVPGPLYTLAKKLLKKIRIDPVIDNGKCSSCRICEKNCPAACIKITSGKGGKIDYNRCIMCFCCQELCSYKAITLKSNFLARALLRLA